MAPKNEKKKVESTHDISDAKKSPIIGKYVGKCCDANVMNNNGMILNRKLFQNIINSTEYKDAIKRGHYIGYLGHPEDPGCMDYMNGCIVMRDMKMDANGEIEGTFDLIATPVGQIVKTYIDAGIKFGISIRGAGDIGPDGTVDPDTFAFRGFDLVTFPAYNDAMPEFEEVAASTDPKKKSQYAAVTAAIKNNASKITSCDAIEILQKPLSESSDSYQILEDQKASLDQAVEEEIDKDEYIAVLEQKLQGMTNLYLEQAEANKILNDSLIEAQLAVSNVTAANNRRLASIKRITGDQIASLTKAIQASDNKIAVLSNSNKKLKNSVESKIEANTELKSEVSTLKSKVSSLESEKKRLIAANTRIAERNKNFLETKNKIISEEKNKNLVYEQKIEASTDVLSNLKSELAETVSAKKSAEKEASVLGKEVESLRRSVEAAHEVIASYQQAYADMIAGAVGVQLSNIPVTATTSVSELQELIYGATSTSGIPAAPHVDDEYIESIDVVEDVDGIITI